MNDLTKLSDVAPWRRMRYIPIFLVTASMTFIFSLRSTFSIALVAMTSNKTRSSAEVFEWDDATRSTLLSSVNWGQLVATIPCGFLIQRFGYRWILLTGMILTTVITFVLPIVTTTWGWVGLCILKVFQGVVQGPVYTGTMRTVAKWALPTESRLAFSIAASGMNIGNFLGMLTGGFWAKSEGGWPAIFYFSGILLFFWCILWFFFGYDDYKSHPYISNQEYAYIQSFSCKKTVRPSFKVPFKDMMLSVPLWTYFVCLGVHSCGDSIFTTRLPTYMNYILKFEIETNGLLSSLPYLALVVAAVTYAWLFDVVMQRSKLGKPMVSKLFNAIGSIGPMIMMIGVSLVQDETWTVVFFVLCCLLRAAVFVSSLRGAVELAPNFVAVTGTIGGEVVHIVSLIVPYASAAIVVDKESIDDWRVLFWLTAGLYFVMFVTYSLFSSNEVQHWNKVKNDQNFPDPEASKT